MAFIPVPREKMLRALLGGTGEGLAGGMTVTSGRQMQIHFTRLMASGVNP